MRLRSTSLVSLVLCAATLIGLAFLGAACGGGGNDAEAPATDWDALVWDTGTWS